MSTTIVKSHRRISAKGSVAVVKSHKRVKAKEGFKPLNPKTGELFKKKSVREGGIGKKLVAGRPLMYRRRSPSLLNRVGIGVRSVKGNRIGMVKRNRVLAGIGAAGALGGGAYAMSRRRKND
jgi:hypothetical protein